MHNAHPAGEALDGVDIQPVAGDECRNFGNLSRRDLPAEERDDVAVAPLAGHPGIVLLALDGREAYLNPEARGLEQQVLHDEARLLGSGAEQDAERQRLVDVGLAYIQDERVVTGKDARKFGGQARLVLTGDVDLYYLYHLQS